MSKLLILTFLGPAMGLVQTALAQTSFTCVPGLLTPIRVTWNGEIACYSADSKNCVFVNTVFECSRLAMEAQPSQSYVECGSYLKGVQGVTGYDQGANHWCNIGQLALLGPPPKPNTWYSCYPNIWTPLRLTDSKDIACLSWDGQNCLWGLNADDCKRIAATATPNSLNVICGASLKQQTGKIGYDDPSHWCSQGRAAFASGPAPLPGNPGPPPQGSPAWMYAQAGQYVCIDGVNTPLKISPANEIACASVDSVGCIWTANIDACRQLASTLDFNAQPFFECGGRSLAVYGATGYEDPNTWCSKGRNALIGAATPPSNNCGRCRTPCGEPYLPGSGSLTKPTCMVNKQGGKCSASLVAGGTGYLDFCDNYQATGAVTGGQTCSPTQLLCRQNNGQYGCVESYSNPLNCGACRRQCAANQRCRAGQCVDANRYWNPLWIPGCNTMSLSPNPGEGCDGALEKNGLNYCVSPRQSVRCQNGVWTLNPPCQGLSFCGYDFINNVYGMCTSVGFGACSPEAGARRQRKRWQEFVEESLVSKKRDLGLQWAPRIHE